MKTLIGLPTYDGRIHAGLVPFLRESQGELRVIEHLPTDVSRNALVQWAKARHADYLWMLDSDAVPAEGTYQAFTEFAAKSPVPAVVAAPYWPVHINGDKQGWIKEDVAGTHVVLYDMRVFDSVEPPYFANQYNGLRSCLTDTEDYVLHRRLSQAYVPIWIGYDYWAGHAKTHIYDRPTMLHRYANPITSE
jgi:hypothetical protein